MLIVFLCRQSLQVRLRFGGLLIGRDPEIRGGAFCIMQRMITAFPLRELPVNIPPILRLSARRFWWFFGMGRPSVQIAIGLLSVACPPMQPG